MTSTMKKILLYGGVILLIVILFELFLGETAQKRRQNEDGKYKSITRAEKREAANEEFKTELADAFGEIVDAGEELVQEIKAELPSLDPEKDDAFANATGVSHWQIWYSKGDGSEYNNQIEMPDQAFSYKHFKKECGDKAFLLQMTQIHKESSTSDDSETGDHSYWFIRVTSKENIGTSYNTFATFPHEHFSLKRGKAEFDHDVYIEFFTRVSKETYDANN